MKTAVVNASVVLLLLLLCATAAVQRVEMSVAIGPGATAGRGDGVGQVFPMFEIGLHLLGGGTKAVVILLQDFVDR